MDFLLKFISIFDESDGFVEKINSDLVSIRLNFVANKTASSLYGQARVNDTPILDKNVYIDAFNKIENAILLDLKMRHDSE